MKLLRSFWTDESGQGLTEYAVIIALVSVALLVVLAAFREELATVFNKIRTSLENQTITQAST
jgi:pilus assembly protein Flp/PilA